MLFGTSIQGSNRPLYVIAAHRLHHKYPDQPEDPHSPRDRNFLETWLGRFKVNPVLLMKQLNKDDFKNKELIYNIGLSFSPFVNIQKGLGSYNY